MRIKSTVAFKIGLGFLLITIAVVLDTLIHVRITKNVEQENERVTRVFEPAQAELQKLRSVLNNSLKLADNWVHVGAGRISPTKSSLLEIQEVTYPNLMDSISLGAEKWMLEDNQLLYDIQMAVRDTLFPLQQELIRLYEFIPGMGISIDSIIRVQNTITQSGSRIINRVNSLLYLNNQRIARSKENLNHSLEVARDTTILMSMILILISVLTGLLVIRSLIHPVRNLKKALNQMSKGIVPDQKLPVSRDEIGEMSSSVNNLMSSLKELTRFSEEIGKGNFDYPYRPLGKEDSLGNAVLHMKDNLQKAAQEDARRRKEDENRNWINNGLAMFGEILRNNNNDLETLADNISGNLTQYLNAVATGVFIMNEHESGPMLDLAGAYAYERKKHLQRSFDIGEGLVGRCVQEGETIYLTDLPDDYFNVLSGMGSGKPKALLIIPLQLNEEKLGALEIASFREFEPYHIEFTERLSQSIASTLANVRSNIQTNTLLQQSQQQAEELATQEEELRQNMEEMRTIQEQSEEKQEKLKKELEECRRKIKGS